MREIRGRSLVLRSAFGPFEIKECTVPEPAPGTLLLKVELAGICGTDLHIYRGEEGEEIFPIVLGHEVAGRITALGKGVTTDFLGRKVHEGDLVVPAPNVVCGKCFFCRCLGSPILCQRMKSYGLLSGSSESVLCFSGGYGEYLYLSMADSSFFKIAAKPEVAVLAEPLTMGIHTAEVGNIQIGDTVVVQGAGAIGLACVLAAKLSGATSTVCIDVDNSERVETASLLGADTTFLTSSTDFHERLALIREQSIHGLGADAVINATGCPTKTVNEGIAYLRNGGRYVDVGSWPDIGDSHINFCREVLRKGIKVLSVPDNADKYFVQAVAVLEKADTNFDKVVSHRFPLGRASDVFRALVGQEPLDGRRPVKVVLGPWAE